MTIQPIPVPPGTYYFDMPVTLLGLTYTLTMRWNTRVGIWTADLADIAGTLIVGGLALRTNRNALEPYYYSTSVPRGVLMVIDNSGKDADPGRDSFASTHTLLFGAP